MTNPCKDNPSDICMMTDSEFSDMWNYLHRMTCLSERRNDFFCDYCEILIMNAKEAYYDGYPIMSDKVFDDFEQHLKTYRPESEVLKEVGFKKKKAKKKKAPMPAPPKMPMPPGMPMP